MSFTFNADETPQQREERKNKAVMSALYGSAYGFRKAWAKEWPL